AAGDSARLQAVPGIGKRTAERIVVEHKTKVTEPTIVITRPANTADDPRSLAREGLLGLGFASTEIDALLDNASGDTPEALIAHALKVSRR
ncbi:MAG TPA: helix-hairpin-helix domain-containing protein, partial [Solirubrobacter sp.]|nr:helix-hairpin-helix domain-containing protein [Solirubrobacter sp.]